MADGDVAAVLIPVLVETLGSDDRDASEAAQKRLVEFGALAADALADALSNERVNMEALMVLGRIGKPAVAAAVSLEHALDEGAGPYGGGLLRFMAAAALAEVGQGTEAGEKALALLRRGLESAEKVESAAALRFVPAASAVPLLITTLSAGMAADADGDSREAAKMAAEDIGLVGKAASSAAPALVAALVAASDEVRSASADALTSIGEEAAIDAVLEALNEGEEPMRVAAAGFLSQNPRLGSQAGYAVPVLMHMIMAGSIAEICAAARVLGCLGDQAGPVLPLLQQTLDDRVLLRDGEPSAFERERAIFDGLGGIGESASPVLSRYLDAPEGSRRKYAALALAKFGRDHAAAALPILQKMALEEADAEAAEALRRLGN